MKQMQVRKQSIQNRDYPSYFIIPAAIVFLLFFITPVIMGIGYSFTNWNVRNPGIDFVGFDQYIQLFQDELFVQALAHTFLFAICTMVLQNVLGLGLALIMFQKLKTREYLQTIFFLPCILSPLIVGYAFRAILHPTGILNQMLESMGMGGMAADWLNTPGLVMFAVIGVNVWMMMGFNMTIYLTGLKNIPADMLEASTIDGASPWQRFTKVIMPMLAPAMTINVLMSFIDGMKVFEIVFALTRGGPGHMSEVLNGVVYRSFGQGRYAYGTAASVVLFVIITILAIFILRYFRSKEVDA